MEQERIVEKIRKLLALATSSNQAEAEAAAAKAQALLQAYNLERAQIEGAAGARPLYLKQIVELGSNQRWRRYLLDAIADAHFCKAVYTPGQPRMSMIGEPHNLDVVEFLYLCLARQLESLAAAAYRQSRSPLAAVTWKDGFYLGAVSSLRQRLERQHQDFAHTSEQTRALVVIKDAALQEAVATFFPKVRTAAPKHLLSADGWQAGVQAGQAIDLQAGVQPGRAATKRLEERKER